MWVGVLSTLLVDFLELLQGNQNHHPFIRWSEIVEFPPNERPCSLRHCFNGTANSGRCWRGFFEAHQHSNEEPMFGVLQPFSFRNCIVMHDFLFAKIVLRQWLTVSFFFAPPWKYRRMVSVCSLSRFLLHVLRFVEHPTPVCQRRQFFWQNQGLMQNRNWSVYYKCCKTPLVLQISPATAMNDPDLRERIAIKTLQRRILAKLQNLCLGHIYKLFLWFFADLDDLLDSCLEGTVPSAEVLRTSR